jgi:hypothetical protein
MPSGSQYFHIPAIKGLKFGFILLARAGGDQELFC